MKVQNKPDLCAEREELIASHCQRLVGDLRQIDPVFYANYFHLGFAPDLAGEIEQIVLRNFPGGELSFSGLGDVAIDWDHKPVCGIDFEFYADGITVFFRLVIRARDHCVELHHIGFEPLLQTDNVQSPADNNTRTNNARLERALKKARCGNLHQALKAE